MSDPSEWDKFEAQVTALLSKWRTINEAHPGYPGRCIGVCVVEINEIDVVVKRREQIEKTM
ncbi:hypothetical protein HP398_29720 [Brevibacillus sp. HB1.4B]|uniref:hypothetical protein n=1 Tax=Brevibacillus sp. HB1.4B TaxID=2738845 RepID=UPI00156B4C58|nr:hypothetical protein [Brevibacillus sp. HB1.4B]NRS20601.1 hypothetical protein [Brevibacillus sp. HB1.4B]